MNQSEFIVASRLLASRYREAQITQTFLAKKLSIPQSQISRVLGGKIKKPNNAYFELCNYANSKLGYIGKKNTEIPAEILRAIDEVWDGSLDHAKALAAVIRSLAVLKLQNRLGNDR